MAVRRKRFTRAEKMLLLRGVELVPETQRNLLDELLKFVMGIKQNLFRKKELILKKNKYVPWGRTLTTKDNYLGKQKNWFKEN